MNVSVSNLQYRMQCDHDITENIEKNQEVGQDGYYVAFST